ncbi:MAG: ABC transporter permease, partial [Gemmatimonadaceae bacterium]
MHELVDRELRFHIEERIDGLMASGMTRAQAEAEMQRKFGDYRRYRDETESIDTDIVRRRARLDLVDGVRRGVSLAVRTLARTPGFTALAIVTLALGIGATVAIHSVLDAVVLRPLPFARPHELVAVKHPANVPGSGETKWAVSVAGYHNLKDESTTLADLGAFRTFETTIVKDGEAVRAPAALVTASLGSLLGLNTIVGRSITPRDDQPGAEAVVVLGHDVWQTRFGSDPNVIGQSVDLGGFSCQIIGVMRPGTVLPFIDVGSTGSSGHALHRVDFWLPFRLDPNASAVNSHFLLVVGRMNPGVTLQMVQTDLERLVDRFPQRFPSAYSTTFIADDRFGVAATPLRRDVLGSTERV